MSSLSEKFSQSRVGRPRLPDGILMSGTVAAGGEPYTARTLQSMGYRGTAIAILAVHQDEPAARALFDAASAQRGGYRMRRRTLLAELGRLARWPVDREVADDAEELVLDVARYLFATPMPVADACRLVRGHRQHRQWLASCQMVGQ